MAEHPKEEDQVIPVVKEEIAVGKRATERHYRIAPTSSKPRSRSRPRFTMSG